MKFIKWILKYISTKQIIIPDNTWWLNYLFYLILNEAIKLELTNNTLKNHVW